nr:hypothetical protein [Paenibacillus bovis]
MKLGAKKIINGNVRDILKELKIDKHSNSKKNFMKEAKAIAKKHSK